MSDILSVTEYLPRGAAVLENGAIIEIKPTRILVTRMCIVAGEFLRVYYGSSYTDCQVRANDRKFVAYSPVMQDLVETTILDASEEELSVCTIEVTIDGKAVYLEVRGGSIYLRHDKMVFYRIFDHNIFRINLNTAGELVFFPEYVDESVMYMYTPHVTLLAPTDSRVMKMMFDERINDMYIDLDLYDQFVRQCAAGQSPCLATALTTRIDEYREICDEALTHGFDYLADLLKLIDRHYYLQRQLERFTRIDELRAEIKNDKCC